MSVLPVPTADEVEQVVALRDPDLVEAAREVDQTLLRWSLGLTPSSACELARRPPTPSSA